ncbi:hypothetical protein L4D77_09330 [Photobacterium frigidiphilum]|uniref:hypothetical protein n=1 Tax=Photobacterium frigidiphilum TaxID=264736 RepID=UPI003D0B9A28
MPLFFESLVLHAGGIDLGKCLLSDEPLDPKWIESPAFTGRALARYTRFSDSYSERVQQIFKDIVAKIPNDWQQVPMVVLLPAFSADHVHSSSHVFSHYCDVLPALSEHDNLYLYPYGRAAFLLALKRIEALLYKGTFSSVLVIAIDTNSRFCCKQAEVDFPKKAFNDVSVVACDSAAIVRVTQASSGLVTHWQSYAAQAEANATGSAVSNLFHQYIQQCGLPIQAMQLPTNNSIPMTNEWVQGMQILAEKFSINLQCFFNGIRIGDVGCTSGLLNVLHTQKMYQQKLVSITEGVFHLDIADGLYRSAAMFGWHEKQSDNALWG